MCTHNFELYISPSALCTVILLMKKTVSNSRAKPEIYCYDRVVSAILTQIVAVVTKSRAFLAKVLVQGVPG